MHGDSEDSGAKGPSADDRPWQQQLGAGAIALVYLVLLLAGAPALDFLQSSPGHATGWLNTVREVDGALRVPLVAKLRPLEKALGVRQQWHFYGTGASKNRRFEIFVDGERWFRVNSEKDTFLASPFANPRLRHLMKNWVKKGHHQRELTRYVAHQVRLVKPEVQLVELVASEARFPDRRRKELRRSRQRLSGIPGDEP